MKILYLDCGMGAAGDMLAGALLELLPDREAFIKKINGLKIPEVVVKAEKSIKCGIRGTHFQVKVKGKEEEEHYGHSHHDHGSHEHSHVHTGHTHERTGHTHEYSHAHSDHAQGHHTHSRLKEIEHLVGELLLSAKVKENILAVYRLIAQAESKVHGMPVEEIHFHEVGTVDALTDIAAVCLLMEELAPDRVVVSPIHIGSGQVKCAHGILPVPAPATAHLLQNVPIYGGKIKGELCTPTGAALLKYFAASFGDMPLMQIKAIGYGMGKKDFEAANCVRALWGESQDGEDAVWELSCNVDDMTPEAIGFAQEELLAAGALEAYTIPVGMKKSRPGICLSLLCKEEKRESLVQALFKHTTTLGIRERKLHRYVLERTLREENTPLGTVRVKEAAGYGVSRKKYEYEDLAGLARKNGMSLEEVVQRLDR